MADPLPIGICEPAGLQPPTDMQTLAVPAAGNSAAAAAAGTSAGTFGATAVLGGVGAGKRTSGVWQYFDLFDPPDAVGKNTRCHVRRSLPADGMFPARTSISGARFKYVSADRTFGVHGTGTSVFFNHLERCHPTEHALVKEASRSSSNAKRAKSQVLTGNSAKRPKTGGARNLEDLLIRPMSTKEKEEQHTRNVIMCFVDVRPFNMARQSGFQNFLGGLCPAYVQTTIHHDTMSRILDGLADAVRDDIIAKLMEQLESAIVPSHPIPAQ